MNFVLLVPESKCAVDDKRALIGQQRSNHALRRLYRRQAVVVHLRRRNASGQVVEILAWSGRELFVKAERKAAVRGTTRLQIRKKNTVRIGLKFIIKSNNLRPETRLYAIMLTLSSLKL